MPGLGSSCGALAQLSQASQALRCLESWKLWQGIAAAAWVRDTHLGSLGDQRMVTETKKEVEREVLWQKCWGCCLFGVSEQAWKQSYLI